MLDKMLINNQWVGGEGTHESMPLINPATEREFARVPLASEADIGEAVESARNAFPQWAALSPWQRGA